MKKNIIFIIINIFFVLNIVIVNAECHVERFYSVETYKPHSNLIDVDNNISSAGFFNSENIFIKINSLGTYYNRSSLSNDILTNTNKNYQIKEKTEADPIYFYLETDETIQVSEINFDINAINSKSGKNVTKRVYLNSYKYCDNQSTGHISMHYGDLVYKGNSNEMINLSLNDRECNSILIEFDYDEDNIYTLNYFQVSKYKRKEHSGWTSEYINDVRVKSLVICDGSGNYIPNGTEKKWYQSYSTIFSPSVDIVSDYIPKITGSYVIKHDGQKNGKLAYSARPEDVYFYFDDYDKINGWEAVGNLPYRNFYSTGETNDYIMTSETEGHRYKVSPYYWDGISENSIHSLDSSYCKVFCGKNVRPCYKHYGHISYTPANYFDIYITKYNNIVPEENRKIDNVKYYLCNASDQCSFIGIENEESFKYDFTESGKYYIKALLTDIYGNSNYKSSELFLIDNDLPMVSFSKTNKDYLQINAEISDVHSGVSYYTYSISDDGGKTYSEESERFYDNHLTLDITSSGDFKLKVYAIDNAGNSSTVISDVYSQYINDISISDAYGFSYDRNGVGKIYYRINKDGNQNVENVNVRIYQNDILLENKVLEISDSITDSFIYTESNYYSKFRIEIMNSDADTENNKLTIYTYAKSKKSRINSEKINRYSGIVCSMVNNGIQKNYSESVIVQVVQDIDNIVAGSGLEIRLNTNYYNQCYEVENFKCKLFIDEKFTFNIKFEEGDSSLDSIFKTSEGYYKQSLIKDGNIYRLEHLYTDKISGKLYNYLKYPALLDAGNKWYSSFSSKFDNYAYEITGEKMGYNEFELVYYGDYSIDSVYTEDIKVRFVDPSDPFPNRKSELWDSLSFFENLNYQIIKIYEIFQ